MHKYMQVTLKVLTKAHLLKFLMQRINIWWRNEKTKGSFFENQHKYFEFSDFTR